MEAFSHSIRQSRRIVLHPRHRAPLARPYTKETLNLKRRRAASRSFPRGNVKVHPTRPRRPPLPKPVAFGKPRDLSSNAAKSERFKESRRIEKALRHEHHGKNVYAYAHIRTGQVVYSLTRVMDNNRILRQLVFHGKKTVPASLRRDLWTPYFSLHLPSSYSGLLAYRQLRELSLQRQLKPPDYLVMRKIQTATPERRARMSKGEEERWDKEREGKPYPDGGQRLASRHDRAKALMMQKATSVADVAFVVDLMQREGNLLGPVSAEERAKARQAERYDEAGKRRKKKLRRERRREEMKEQRYQEAARQAQEGTKWGLEMYAAKRIATEHGGAVVDPFLGRARVLLPRKEGKASEVEPANGPAGDATAITGPTTPEPPPQVRIFWSDLRDAAYAAKWPEVVFHGELERLAVSRRAVGDAAGQTQQAHHIIDRSVHVIGGMKMGGEDGWMRGMSPSPSSPGSPRQGLERDGDGDGDGDRGATSTGPGPNKNRSRSSREEELEKEGVVMVGPSPRRTSILAWVKERFGLAA